MSSSDVLKVVYVCSIDVKASYPAQIINFGKITCLQEAFELVAFCHLFDRIFY